MKQEKPKVKKLKKKITGSNKSWKLLFFLIAYAKQRRLKR